MPKAKQTKGLETIVREYTLALCQDQVYSLIAQLIPTHIFYPEQEELAFIGFSLDDARSRFMFTYKWSNFPVDKTQCRQFFYFEVADDKILGKTYIQQGSHQPWELLAHDENTNLGDE